jgi:hypothetical protein
MHRRSVVSIAFAIVAILGALDGCLVTCLSGPSGARDRSTERAHCHQAVSTPAAGNVWQAGTSCHEHPFTSWFESSTPVRLDSPTDCRALPACASLSAPIRIPIHRLASASAGATKFALTLAFTPLRI